MLVAKDISSKGLVYALPRDGDDDDIGESDYEAALQNILLAQDFDSIPLRKNDSKRVEGVARNMGSSNLPKIIRLEDVRKLKSDSSIIECMTALVSPENQNHMVYLFDDIEDHFNHVVSPSMLMNKLVEDYFTLLTVNLEKKGFWKQKGIPAPSAEELCEIGIRIEEYALCFDYTTAVSEERQNTAQELLRKILEPFQNCWNKEDFDIGNCLQAKITTYEEGTAAFYVRNPYGQIQVENSENLSEIERLAFNLFSKANEWDTILCFALSESKYKQIVRNEKDLIEVRPIRSIEKTMNRAELIPLFEQDSSPMVTKLEVQENEYMFILSLGDIIFHQDTKDKLAHLGIKLDLITQVLWSDLYNAGVKCPSTSAANFFSEDNWKKSPSFENVKVIRNGREIFADFMKSIRNPLMHGGLSVDTDHRLANTIACEFLKSISYNDIVEIQEVVKHLFPSHYKWWGVLEELRQLIKEPKELKTVTGMVKKATKVGISLSITRKEGRSLIEGGTITIYAFDKYFQEENRISKESFKKLCEDSDIKYHEANIEEEFEKKFSIQQGSKQLEDLDKTQMEKFRKWVVKYMEFPFFAERYSKIFPYKWQPNEKEWLPNHKHCQFEDLLELELRELAVEYFSKILDSDYDFNSKCVPIVHNSFQAMMRIFWRSKRENQKEKFDEWKQSIVNQKAFFERLQSTVKETHLITLNDDMETYRLEEISPEIDDHEEENMKDFCSHVGKDGVITVQQAVNSFLNDDDKFTLSQVKKYFEHKEEDYTRREGQEIRKELVGKGWLESENYKLTEKGVRCRANAMRRS